MPVINLREDNIEAGNQKKRSVTLVVTSKCNLACKYCYEKHDLRDERIMKFDLAKEMICKYMREDGYDAVQIEFFGGEPMLAFPLIKNIVDWFHSRKWDKKHKFLIGTNGTILDEDMKNWLYRNRGCVNIALSLDGTKTSHNICRSNSYDLVIRNLPFFREYWPHQPIKMTISADTIPYVSESVIELEEMGLLFTSNMAFEDMWGDEYSKNKLLEIYERQLSTLVDYYLERPRLHPVTPLLTAVPAYLGLPVHDNTDTNEKNSIKRFCGSGHEMVVIDVDGSEYPCHRFLPWVSGHPAPQGEVNCQTAWKPEKCAKCELIPSCPTCAGLNWEINGDTGIRTTFHCESYKTEVFYSCLLEHNLMKQKLKSTGRLSIKEKKSIKTRIEALLHVLENWDNW